MKIRKERYARERLARDEDMERGAIIAHFNEELLRPRRRDLNAGPHGSIEERIANAHRMDLRPPRV